MARLMTSFEEMSIIPIDDEAPTTRIEVPNELDDELEEEHLADTMPRISLSELAAWADRRGRRRLDD